MRRLTLLFSLAALEACHCGTVQTIAPSISVAPVALDFGSVKNGTMATLSLKISSTTQSDLSITKLTLDNGSEPGGTEGFTVALDAFDVDPLGSKTLPITFSPTVLQAYEAILTITSNDTDHPTIRVPITGTGSKPTIQVTPECPPARMCTGTVVVSPPSIDFGALPSMSTTMVDASKLPDVAITNVGDVPLTISTLAITGTDAAAFVIQATTVSTPLTYQPMAGVTVPIRFTPLNDTQMSYAADLTIASDDLDQPTVLVHLTGTLRANLPPVVCANLISVAPVDDTPVDYSSPAQWAMLTTVPPGGYDFTAIRDVPPRATIAFSALSSATDVTACTSDPEDGRTGLTYQWAVTAMPTGATAFAVGTTPVYSITPVVTGVYQVTLMVADMQGHMAAPVLIKFAVAIKQDLVAQLQWDGFTNVDLDVHLVRPSAATQPTDPFSGVFDFFDEGSNGKTSGDINGYSVTRQTNTAGLDFDWGQVGTPDDPRLNIDDTGSGDLLENVSLNYPEHDALCDGGRCKYKVLVHYFNDKRTGAFDACFVDGGTGCTDGDSCSCTDPDDRCVATSSIDGGAPVGVGQCRPAPTPVVKIFLKGNPTPAATIPMPPPALYLGSPCTMLYVADVNWPSQQEQGSLPDGGTPLADVLVKDGGLYARYGVPIGNQCAPDVSITQWYSKQ